MSEANTMSETPSAPAAAGSSAADSAPPPTPAQVLFPEGSEADTGLITDKPPAEGGESGGGGSESAPAGDDSQAAPGGDDTSPAPAGDDSVAGVGAADYDFKFPEGFTASDDLLTEARNVLADAGVPKDKAQGVVDLYVKALEANTATSTAAFEAQQSEWLTQINAMPEFQGATRETSLQAISKVLDEYGAEAKAGILSNPAVGNDPTLVKFMLSVAQALSEGTPASQGRPAPNSRDGRSLVGRTQGQMLFPSDDPAENSINATASR